MNRPTWNEYADRLAEKNKAYEKFHAALQTSSDSTKSTYAYFMKRFMDFLVGQKKIKNNEDYNALAKLDTDKITDILESYVSELNKTHKRKGVSTILAATELFFTMNRKIWHKKLVRKLIKKDENNMSGGKLPATDEDVQTLLEVSKHVREKSLIHFLASTGARPASIVDPILRMKHLVKMPRGCYGIKIYDGDDAGYWSFLTPESGRALDKYFIWRKNQRKEEFTDETPIFANFSKNAKSQHLSLSSLNHIIDKIIHRSGIVRIKDGSMYDKARTKMFRKRFNGKLKMENEVNSNIAEKLMSHKRGLDGVYLQPTREECFTEFEKAIPVLTVDPTERQKRELEEQQKKITELEKKESVIQELKNNQKDDKETLKILSQLYMLEATEPVTHTKEAYEEENQQREELRNRLKKLVKTDELVLDF